MKMKKSLKKKWVKALRSGEYEQTSDTLCNGVGGFCCLGVLEHVVMGGEVEVDGNGNFKCSPSRAFYDYAEIELDIPLIHGHPDDDKAANELIDMNDEVTAMDEDDGVTPVHVHTFNDIANWIEKNVETF